MNTWEVWGCMPGKYLSLRFAQVPESPDLDAEQTAHDVAQTLETHGVHRTEVKLVTEGKML